MNEKIVEVNGYSTFNDVEDHEDRVLKQATIIVNMIMDGSRKHKSKERVWDNVSFYMSQINKSDWPAIYILADKISSERIEKGDI